MKRSLSVAAALLLTTVAGAQAQYSASGTASVSATVELAPLAISTTGNTDFGSLTADEIVNQTGNSFLDPAAPAVGQSTALFTATGEPNLDVVVTCDPMSMLTSGSDPNEMLSYTPYVSIADIAEGQSGSSLVCAGANTLSVTLSESGHHYFWLGGVIAPSSSSPPRAGAYSGNFTLSVAY